MIAKPMENRSGSPLAVVIVDDEPSIPKAFSAILKAGGFDKILIINDSREVMSRLYEGNIGVVLLDLTMPHISGEELLDLIKQHDPEISIVIITGNIEIETAVFCMKKGAFDYLVKPVESAKLIATVRRAMELQDLRRENESLKKRFFSDELQHPKVFSEIITTNNRMKTIFLYIEAVAYSKQPVLITGETGVGKELIARAIFRLSNTEGDFVSVNVAGFDDNMFSDTLFGHKKGAFTGAQQSRDGLIETARGGILFLDEIGDLNITSQLKLLRLLESGEFLPLGADVPKRSRARIVLATNRPIEDLVNNGDFRKDLYYRLYTHRILVPPLRERLEDIPALIDHFLADACEELCVDRPRVPSELFNMFGHYHFPGNVRELRSLIFDAVVRMQSSDRNTETLSLETFKEALRQSSTLAGCDTRRDQFIAFGEELPTIKKVMDLLIDEAMKRAKDNQTIASKTLGISQQALSKRLKSRDLQM